MCQLENPDMSMKAKYSYQDFFIGDGGFEDQVVYRLEAGTDEGLS